MAILVERLRADLAKGYGAFGHLFKLEATTAIDLDYALKALPEYGIEIVEGEALLNEYDPEISDNSVT
ncbi:hypothetical protein HY772_05585 [Candidatus Woesearchaeota archaeon]|nr:hypothetical protein [Candidatus Woesearchaeota archaeon]